MPGKAGFYRTTARLLGAIDRRGLVLRYRYGDRRLLEECVLPALDADPAVADVLLVGCAWYTRHYPALLPSAAVITMEIDPAKAVFGGAHHIVADMAHVDAHIAPASLDAVICNGVLGWGLDHPAAIEAAFTGASRCLRLGGLFLLGWNDIAPRNACPPDTIAALDGLATADIPGLRTHSVVAQARNRHCYQAWRKPLPA